jgi:hypothetical protein
MRKRVEGAVSTWLVPLGMLLVVMMWVALFMGYRSLARDIELPDDSHLMPVRSEVADADNGYLVLMASTGLYVRVELEDGSKAMSDCGEMAIGVREWDDVVVNAVLASNVAFIAAIEVCADRPEFRAPKPNGFMDLYPYISYALKGAKLLRLQSAVALRLGDTEAAAAAASQAYRLGRKMLKEPGSLIDGLIALGVGRMGLDSYMRIVRDGASVAEVRQWRENDGGWRFGHDSLIMTMAGEYGQVERMLAELTPMTLTKLSELVGADPGPSLLNNRTMPGILYQPNRTVVEIQQAYEHWLGALEEPVWEREATVFESHMEELRGRLPFCRNAVGIMMLALFFPAVDSVANSWEEADLLAAMIEPVAALQAYRRATGALPESLEVLVPAYLEAAPVDLFDGNPMKYSQERGIVYSVGSDGVDDGGDEGSLGLGNQAKELVFRVEEGEGDGEG